MEDILPELKSFILDFCKRNKIKNIDLSSLNVETSIDLDLNIFAPEGGPLFLPNQLLELDANHQLHNAWIASAADGAETILIAKSSVRVERQIGHGWVHQATEI